MDGQCTVKKLDKPGCRQDLFRRRAFSTCRQIRFSISESRNGHLPIHLFILVT